GPVDFVGPAGDPWRAGVSVGHVEPVEDVDRVAHQEDRVGKPSVQVGVGVVGVLVDLVLELAEVVDRGQDGGRVVVQDRVPGGQVGQEIAVGLGDVGLHDAGGEPVGLGPLGLLVVAHVLGAGAVGPGHAVAFVDARLGQVTGQGGGAGQE